MGLIENAIQQGKPSLRYANRYDRAINAGRDFSQILEFSKPGIVGGEWSNNTPYPNVLSQAEIQYAAAAQTQVYINNYGQTVNRLGVPVFRNEYDQIVDSFGNLSEMGALDPFNFREAQFKIHPREIEKIDKVVARVLRVVAVANRMFRTIFIGRGNVKYTHYENVDGLDPIMSKDFEVFEASLEALKDFDKHLLGVSKDYKIGMLKFDQSRLSNYLPTNIIERTISEFTALVADFRERMIWRGGDIRTNNTGNLSVDARVKGLVTDTDNITDVPITTTAVAGSITTIGDLAKALIELATPLITGNFPGPYNFVVTPGIILQAMKNRHATSDKTDLMNAATLGMEKFGIPIVKNIIYTPHLLNVDGTNTNQKIACFAPMDQSGRANQVIAESYPLWHRPLPLALTFGVAGKIGWYGGAVIRREGSVTLSDDLTVDVFA